MARHQILEPYTRRVDDTLHLVVKLLLIGGLVMFAMLLGFVVAILPMSMLIVPLTPLLFLTGIALWLAPDVDPKLDGVVRKLFLAFLLVMMIWPDYVAVTLPGVGWLSFGRLTMGATAVVSIYAIATSHRVRVHILEVVNSAKPIWWAFLAFVLLQLILAVASMQISSRWFFAQIFWYYILIVAAWVFSSEGSIRRLYQLILIGLSVQCFYGLGEWYMQKPIWTDYIPPFMQVDPALLEKITGYGGRLGVGQYRVGSIYITSLTYAEFIAITLPFVVHAILFGRRKMIKLAAAALFAFVAVNAWMTDQRSAMIGIVISIVLTMGLWGYRRFRVAREDRDMIGPAVVWSFPGFALMAAAMVLFVPRIRTMTLGGAEHKFSNDAREMQWDITLDRLASNPFGYGPFRAGDVVGYTNLAGERTLDSYPINLLMDYGVLGLLLFTAIFALAAWRAMRIYIESHTEEETLAGPLFISIVAFLVIKLVLSQSENHYFMFAMVGCILALNWKQQKRVAAETVAEPAAPEPEKTRMLPSLAYGALPARLG